MFSSPALAQTGGTAAPSDAFAFFNTVFPLLLIFVIFYFLLIRPQQRRIKEHQRMVADVKVRDTAITSGGLIGKVTKVDDNEVELEVAANVKVRVVKSMLSDVRPHGAKAANDQA